MKRPLYMRIEWKKSGVKCGEAGDPLFGQHTFVFKCDTSDEAREVIHTLRMTADMAEAAVKLEKEETL